MSKTKVQKIPKVQVEHFQVLIINPNTTHKRSRKYFDWALYDYNIFELLDFYLNRTYFEKTSKFINMFPNIKRTRLQIMNQMIYIYIFA